MPWLLIYWNSKITEGWRLLDDEKLHNCYVRYEVLTAVTMKNGVFWDVTPRGSCRNRRFGGTYRLLHQGDKNV
jgi:hypothetical protein